MTTEQKAKAWDALEDILIKMMHETAYNGPEGVYRRASIFLITMAETRRRIETEL